MRLRDKLRMLWHKRFEVTFCESGQPTYFKYTSRRKLWRDLKAPTPSDTWIAVDDEWLRSLGEKEPIWIEERDS